MADPERPQTLTQDFTSAHGILDQLYVPTLQTWMADMCPNESKAR
jgi:hypothetical protein